MRRAAAVLVLAGATALAQAQTAPPTAPPAATVIEATTATGEKVRLLPTGRWEYVDTAKQADAQKAQNAVGRDAARVAGLSAGIAGRPVRHRPLHSAGGSAVQPRQRCGAAASDGRAQRGAAHGMAALAIAGVAILIAAYFWVVLSWNYSTGERAGWVQKFSQARAGSARPGRANSRSSPCPARRRRSSSSRSGTTPSPRRSTA